ncbi:hypothetical protein GF386_04370 [Candidatus Pacearchaeota archaeon]|nr:hypothetical protein [Candidatus Pacearchaeota archaeon]MBD3283359.1 hypothetical protein [Candidatus Pacearchaeota archaeon]
MEMKLRKEVFVLVTVLFMIFCVSAQDCPESLSQCSSQELKDFPSFILVSGINSDPESLDDKEVLEELNRRIKEDISILNENQDIKKEWFENYGIEDRGAVVESFDGDVVDLKGELSTSFKISDFSGTKVSKEGLIVKEDVVLTGEVQKLDDGSVSSSGWYSRVSGNEYYANGVLGSGANEEDLFIITVDEDRVSIKGNGVTEKDENGDTISSFDGEIVKENERKILKKGIKYSSFSDDKKSVTYDVDEDVEFITDLRVTEKGAAYIRESKGLVEINSLKEDIEVTVHNENVERFFIGDIDGTSNSVVIKDEEGNTLSFSEGSYTGKGDITALPGIEYKYPSSEDSLKINYQDLGVVESEDYVKTGKYFQKLDSYLKSYGVELEGKKIELAIASEFDEIFITAAGEAIIIDKGGVSGKNAYYLRDGELYLIAGDGSFYSPDPENSRFKFIEKHSLIDAKRAIESGEKPFGYNSMVPKFDEFQDSLLMANIREGIVQPGGTLYYVPNYPALSDGKRRVLDESEEHSELFKMYRKNPPEDLLEFDKFLVHVAPPAPPDMIGEQPSVPTSLNDMPRKLWYIGVNAPRAYRWIGESSWWYVRKWLGDPGLNP